jgi:hypothetical protein
MSDKRAFSPYLVKEDVENTVQMIVRRLLDDPGFADVLPEADRRDGNCYVVVAAPALTEEVFLSAREVKYTVLYEAAFGDQSKWQHNFRGNAWSKVYQLAEDRNEGGPFITPHLLFSGDKPYWGGVKRERIIVACSGFDEHFDRMISGMIADMIIARAHQRFLAQAA